MAYIPLSTTLISVLQQYLSYRGEDDEQYLFCNVYGDMMPRTTLQMSITKYAKKIGVNRYSLHLFRHTFATRYITNGGNPFKLKKILGHATMKMVNHYISLNNKDLINDIDDYNPLDAIVEKEENRTSIKKVK